jgi:hypothetical protein
MSTPHEAGLTEKERAILAGLAAAAEADDPTLAAALRGRSRRIGVPQPVRHALRVPDAVGHWAWGLVLALAGLVVMIVSVATVVGFGVVGALMAFAGTYRVASTLPVAARTRELVDAPGPGRSDD